MIKPWQAFLNGERNVPGVNLNWVLTASNYDLEHRHDWIQWAFPIDTPSQFNPDAPVVTREEMGMLSDRQRANIRRCLAIYATFLQNTQQWHRAGDHNHLRITRVLRCLTLAGMDDMARQWHRYVLANGNPTPETKRFWAEALVL